MLVDLHPYIFLQPEFTITFQFELWESSPPHFNDTPTDVPHSIARMHVRIAQQMGWTLS